MPFIALSTLEIQILQSWQIKVYKLEGLREPGKWLQMEQQIINSPL